MIYSFPVAFVAYYHNLSGFYQQKFILTILQARHPKYVGASHSLGGSGRIHSWPLPAPLVQYSWVCLGFWLHDTHLLVFTLPSAPPLSLVSLCLLQGHTSPDLEPTLMIQDYVFITKSLMNHSCKDPFTKED